jgi:protein-disulfide isomerase
MQDADMAQSLVNWFQANADADGINSTPSFIIDGTKYTNMSYADFAALLDDKLAG